MPNSRKTKANRTNMMTSSVRRSASAPVPTINGLSSILLLSMFTKVNAVLTFYFRLNEMDYTFVTNSDTHGMVRSFALFPIIKDKLLSGDCGNITSINNIATSLTSIWQTKVCKARFDFSRSTNQTAQELFENCTVSSILEPLMLDANKDCNKDLHQLTIALSVVIGVGLTILAIYVTAVIIVARSERQNYVPIPEPAAPVLSSIPAIFQKTTRTKLLNLTSELEGGEPKNDQSPGL